MPVTYHSRQTVERAQWIASQLPKGGLFAGHTWRIAPHPFGLDKRLANQLEKLGRVLLQFYRAVNLLYRKSAEGKLPPWIAQLLDQGKPNALIALQRHDSFRHDLPRIIRPDILLTEEGFSITELDSVPGGIGLTGWLNQQYDRLETHFAPNPTASAESVPVLIGHQDGPVRGFANLFGEADRIRVIVSDESSTYRPEMQWLAEQLRPIKDIEVHDDSFSGFNDGDGVYRFFELFDLDQVRNAQTIFDLAQNRRIKLTAPPKAFLEEKLLLGLLWNRNLREFWRQELGQAFLKTLHQHIPYTWIIDPTPLPPHAAYPDLGLTDWHQLKSLSQKERRLILKISGFAPQAWGARGVHLGSDLSTEAWRAAVDRAIQAFPSNPYILQPYKKPRIVESQWVDLNHQEAQTMKGRVRLCPYYFVVGEGDQARVRLGGCLATICPADKKIIHGMTDAIIAPCSVHEAATQPHQPT